MINLNVEHSFSDRLRILGYKILNNFYRLDSYIMLIYEMFSDYISIFFQCFNFPKEITNLLIGKHLFLFFYMLTNYITVSYFTSLNFTKVLPLKMIYNVTPFFLLVSYYSMLVTDSGYLLRNLKIETFIAEQDPRIAANKCEDCNVIKCMRSYHCSKCEK